MSNRQPGMAGVMFEPVPDLPARGADGILWMLFLGVIYPALVIALEVASRMCATTFFDPMPTYWHTLAVSLVPAANLLMLMHLRDGKPHNVRWLVFANGVAISIAAVYTLLFLPLLPLAIIALVVGLGILPLAPPVSLIAAIRLQVKFHRKYRTQRLVLPLLGGLAAGIGLLIAIDIPPAATRLGMQWAVSSDPAERARGVTLLRTIGDDDVLLHMCYGSLGRPTGLLSALATPGSGWLMLGGPAQAAFSPADAREVYYRVHGVPFNAKPAPFQRGQWPRLADFQADEDHGGTQVGGRLNGLSMASSRIDGSISGDDAVAYLEWTVEFRNSALVDREARLQVALPPGGVVSRATLWVNGEEREAAYGGRGEVRAAYQRVAVAQRRDPLLVTTKGADRVLAQAFPVPRSGGTIKFKLGITAPLELVNDSSARLTLPALVDRNFSLTASNSHDIWIESKQPLATTVRSLSASRVDAGPFRIAGALRDRDLSGVRQVITVDRNPAAGMLAARIGDSELVVQEIARRSPEPTGAAPTGAIMVVIDGSMRLAGTANEIIAALDTIPPVTKVGIIIASEPIERVALAPWTDAHRQAVFRLLRATSFVGGQDNAPALAEALQLLEPERGSTLLWIHGPQPVAFRDSTARLEQASGRVAQLPQVVLYSVEPGPNEVLPDTPWAWSARLLPATGAIAADLTGFLARATGAAHAQVVRRRQGNAEGITKGSDHIARLWANDRVLELMRQNPGSKRAEAVALASQYQLVTPVSGAVVLENQQQYNEARLTPVSQITGTIPTIPEPHEWALLIIGCGGLAWLVWRNRRRVAVA